MRASATSAISTTHSSRVREQLREQLLPRVFHGVPENARGLEQKSADKR
jgi:hypothetical protein